MHDYNLTFKDLQPGDVFEYKDMEGLYHLRIAKNSKGEIPSVSAGSVQVIYLNEFRPSVTKNFDWPLRKIEAELHLDN